MTVSNTTSVTSALLGNGLTTVFSFSPMVIYASTDIEVIHTVTATGVTTTLTEGASDTTYSVGITTYPSTGSITYPAVGGTPIPSTETITIRRVIPIVQPINLSTQGPYDAGVQETALDKLTIMVLQLQEQLDRAIALPAGTAEGFTGDDAAPVADAYLKMDSDLSGVSWSTLATTASNASDTSALGVSLTAAAAGSASDFSREDHVHLLPTVSVAKGGTGAVTAAAALDALGVDGASAVIATGDIADNAITLDKMAGGTDGNLIGIDANGDPAYIATGAANTLLTSNGSGAASSFAWPVLDQDTMSSDSATSLATQQSIKAYVDAERGALEFVSTAAITAATTLEVNDMAAGYDYIIQLEGFSVTSDAQTLWMRYSHDDVPTYESGASDYSWVYETNSGISSSTADTSADIIGSYGNESGTINFVQITLVNPGSTTDKLFAHWNGIMRSWGTPPLVSLLFQGAAVYEQGTESIEDVQFSWSGGSTFKAQGDITVWRRKRS